MAHIWTCFMDDERGRVWAIAPIKKAGESYALTSDAQCPLQPWSKSVEYGMPLITSIKMDERIVWMIMAGQGGKTLVNGIPLFSGLRILCDRDEIFLDGVRYYFSLEELMRIEKFPGTDGSELTCPRCRMQITPDHTAVKCPGCGIWHHQTDELNCWTYTGKCSICDQPTGLDEGYRWSPEDF